VEDNYKILLNDIKESAKGKMVFKSKELIGQEILSPQLAKIVIDLVTSRRGNEIYELAPAVAVEINDPMVKDHILDEIIKNYLNRQTAPIAVIEFFIKNVNKLDVVLMEKIYDTSDEDFKLFLRNVGQKFREDFNIKVYNESGDDAFLPKEVRDIFIF